MHYKTIDRSRKKRYGVVVSSLQDLKKKAQEKFGIDDTSALKIVLENYGFEIGERPTYFLTLDKNTCLVILKKNKDWISPPEYKAIEEEETKEVARPSHEDTALEKTDFTTLSSTFTKSLTSASLHLRRDM